MKTSELINLLQKEDPSGDLHVRIKGMTPTSVKKKLGYEDGPYEYLENGKLIFSTEGYKVDINALDIEDFAWKNFNDWEDKIVFNYTKLNDNEKEESVRARLAKAASEAKEFDSDSVKEFSKFVMDKISNGYKVIQKDTKIGHNNTMFFTKDNEQIKLRQGDCHAIIRGSFKSINKKDHIEWKPD